MTSTLTKKSVKALHAGITNANVCKAFVSLVKHTSKPLYGRFLWRIMCSTSPQGQTSTTAQIHSLTNGKTFTKENRRKHRTLLNSSHEKET